MLFSFNGSKSSLTFVDKIDKAQKKESDSFSAMRKFKDMDKYLDYKSSGNQTETLLDTVHQNTVTEIRAYSYSGSQLSEISTIALDGKMVIWNIKVFIKTH